MLNLCSDFVRIDKESEMLSHTCNNYEFNVRATSRQYINNKHLPVRKICLVILGF